jgi:phenylpropionate dioxygenase-like ring-hydroxylating dioxygenase large terminal subunit
VAVPGREEQVKASGDYFTTTIIGEPLVIVRDRGGTVRALSSVCQHRAMLVAEGAGNTRGFVCPYHHWTYDLDGRLVGAPRWTAPATSTRKATACPN